MIDGAPAPRVTVLLCVWNGERHLQAAIDSILAQSFRDFELLVIDDASTDATPRMLAASTDARVRVVRNETNLGLTVSLNRGLQLARGKLIARQDADDWSEPRRLELQLAFLQAHPAVAAVGSQALLIDSVGRSLGWKDFPLQHRGICWMHLFDNALAHSAVTFRKAVVVAAGGYDETFPASQDYELWSRLSERHRLANLAERLVHLRVLETSITRTHRRPELIWQVQAAHLERILPQGTGRAGSPSQHAGSARSREEEIELIGFFRTRVEAGRLAEFLAVFDEKRAAFEAAFPDARGSADFRRTLAIQYERIGYNLLSTVRGPAMAQLARAIETWPPRVFSMPWMRIAALALLGDSARAFYERLRGKAATS